MVVHPCAATLPSVRLCLSDPDRLLRQCCVKKKRKLAVRKLVLWHYVRRCGIKLHAINCYLEPVLAQKATVKCLSVFLRPQFKRNTGPHRKLAVIVCAKTHKREMKRRRKKWNAPYTPIQTWRGRTGHRVLDIQLGKTITEVGRMMGIWGLISSNQPQNSKVNAEREEGNDCPGWY